MNITPSACQLVRNKKASPEWGGAILLNNRFYIEKLAKRILIFLCDDEVAR